MNADVILLLAIVFVVLDKGAMTHNNFKFLVVHQLRVYSVYHSLNQNLSDICNFAYWFSNHATGLQCWKCIAQDCENNPEGNYKASKVACRNGQQCMKVRYKMFDNKTHYDSVIRTCTSGPCLATTEEQFRICIDTPKLYMISGCSLRKCCEDKDLCNQAAYIKSAVPYVLTLCIINKIILMFLCHK